MKRIRGLATVFPPPSLSVMLQVPQSEMDMSKVKALILKNIVMKRTFINLFAVAAIAFSACNNSGTEKGNTDPQKSNADTSKMMSAVKYTCTMHPEVISDTAGHCPKCGMDLVPLEDSTMKKMNMDTTKHN